jgi:hypothetical protein
MLSMFEETVYGVKFPALQGSPTVSVSFVRQDLRGVVKSGFSETASERARYD